MRTFGILLATVVSFSAFATTQSFEIQIKEISINGSLMPNNRTFTVKSNKPEVISRSVAENGASTIVEITAADKSQKPEDGILASFTIREEYKGARKILGRPQIIAAPGKEASISEGKEGEAPLIKIAIIVNRVK